MACNVDQSYFSKHTLQQRAFVQDTRRSVIIIGYRILLSFWMGCFEFSSGSALMQSIYSDGLRAALRARGRRLGLLASRSFAAIFCSQPLVIVLSLLLGVVIGLLLHLLPFLVIIVVLGLRLGGGLRRGLRCGRGLVDLALAAQQAQYLLGDTFGKLPSKALHI